MHEQVATYDLRERKKSKYLSYPFINMGSGHQGFPVKTEDSQTPSHSQQVEGSSVANNHFNGSPTTVKSGKKRLRSRWRRKFVQWSTMSSSQEFINSSSSELLVSLYSKAVDCNFPYMNRKSELVEWFFSTFRLSTFHDEAEFAAALVNQKSGKSRTRTRNDSLNANNEQKKRKKKLEQAPRHKNKSLRSQSDMNKGVAASGCLSKCSAEMNNTRPGEIKEEVTLALQLQNVESTTLERSSGAKCSLAPKASQVLDCLSSECVAVPKKMKTKKASIDNRRTKSFSKKLKGGEKSNKSSSFVIDLQMVPPPRNGSPGKTNGENKVELDLIVSNPVLYASQSHSVGNAGNGFSSVNAPVEHLKNKLVAVIPDLNGNDTEYNSTQKKLEGDNGFSSKLTSKLNQKMSQEPKSGLSRSIYAGLEFNQTINYNRMEVSGDAKRTCLLLQFEPGASLPSKEELLERFCRFGPLDVPETQILKDGHARIVFLRSADAGEAFHNLEQNNPFGTILIGCKLHHLSEDIASIKQNVMIAGHSGSKSQHCDRPSLDSIRQNLQMMASTLEERGHTISPQMRDKLEGEIKNLLEKVNSIGSFSN